MEYILTDPLNRKNNLVIYGNASVGKSFLVNKVIALLLPNYKVYSSEDGDNNLYQYLDKNVHKRKLYSNEYEHNNFIIMAWKHIADTDKHTFENIYISDS
jgi:hypothetical protein